MNYSILDYLQDIDPRTKRPFWNVWAFIAIALLIGCIIIQPPVGAVPIAIGYILWFLRNYWIESNERKRKKTDNNKIY